MQQEQLYQVLMTQNGQTFKVVHAEKLTKKNQYMEDWKQVNARNLSRTLNKSKLVIK